MVLTYQANSPAGEPQCPGDSAGPGDSFEVSDTHTQAIALPPGALTIWVTHADLAHSVC